MIKRIFIIAIVLIAGAISISAQGVCPADKVCISQETANKLFTTVDQLIAAKDLITKLTNERSTSDVALAKALHVIEEWKEVDVVNGMIQAKYEKMMDLYEKTVTLAFSVIEKLQTQLNKPKSGWNKFLDGVKQVLTIVVGIVIGRGIGQIESKMRPTFATASKPTYIRSQDLRRPLTGWVEHYSYRTS